jgi:hypothetical protein
MKSATLLLIPGLALLPILAQADTLTFTSAKDNALYQDVTGGLSNGAGQWMFAGLTGGSGIRRALLFFDLTAIPAGSTVNGVSLQLHMSRTISGESPIALQRMLADWGEGTSDAGNRAGGGASSATGGRCHQILTFGGLPVGRARDRAERGRKFRPGMPGSHQSEDGGGAGPAEQALPQGRQRPGRSRFSRGGGPRHDSHGSSSPLPDTLGIKTLRQGGDDGLHLLAAYEPLRRCLGDGHRELQWIDRGRGPEGQPDRSLFRGAGRACADEGDQRPRPARKRVRQLTILAPTE